MAGDEATTTRRTRRANERGQAVTETILLTWVMLVFFAAAYQMFIVNESIYRAMTAVEAEAFSRAFQHNCYKKGNNCRFDVDGHAMPKWNEQTFPEVRIRTVSFFSKFGMPNRVLIASNQWMVEPDCPQPCKRTSFGAGTYFPILPCVTFGCMPGTHP